MKKFFAFFLSLTICLTFSAIPAYAGVDDFNESDYPQIFERKFDEIDDFYMNASYEDLISSQNAYIHDETLEGGYAVKAFTIAFLLTDYYNVTNADYQAMADNLLSSLYYPVYSKYTGVVSISYDLSIFHMQKINNANFSVTHYYYICITLNLRETPEQTEMIITDFVRPFLATLPSDMTTIQKIYKINQYILNGQFSYDMSLINRKSVYQMVFTDKEGVCEEYAGLSMLFFNELGLENILIYGTVNTYESHVWNLVKVGDVWYNSDILWDGPVDGSGAHAEVTTNYLLKSTEKFQADHSVDSEYSEIAALANQNIDERLFIYGERVDNPNVPDVPVASQISAKSITLASVDGVEYSKDGTTWQSENVFTNLEPDTEYTFYARYAQTTQYNPSAPSQGSVIRTNKTVSKGDIDGDNETTLADAMIAFRCISGDIEIAQNELTAFDLDGNGKINLVEVMKIFLYVSGRINTI